MQTPAQNVARATEWLSSQVVRYYHQVLALLLTGVLAASHFLLLSSQIPPLLQLLASTLLVCVAICLGAVFLGARDANLELLSAAALAEGESRSRYDWDGELSRIVAEVNSLEDHWHTQQAEESQVAMVDLSPQLPWLKAAGSAGQL